MRIEESKVTPGMWFVRNKNDNIISIVYSKVKAIIKMKEIQSIEERTK